MKTWDLFLRDVLPKVPGCPEPVAEHAVLRSAQEFCETTAVWSLWLDDIATIAEVSEYDIPLESKSELVRLERATLDGREVCVRTEQMLPADWKTYEQGIADGLHTTDRMTLVLLPTPQVDDLVLKVQAVLRPGEAAAGIEDHLYAQYRAAIAEGAVASLKDHTGKSYSDPAGANVSRIKFNDHMNTVALQKWRGFSSARPRRQIQTF